MPNEARQQNESDGAHYSGDYQDVQRRVQEFNEETDASAQETADAGTPMTPDDAA